MAKPLNCCSVRFEGFLKRVVFGYEFNFKVSFTSLISSWRFFVVEQRALSRSISDRTTNCLCSKGWSDRMPLEHKQSDHPLQHKQSVCTITNWPGQCSLLYHEKPSRWNQRRKRHFKIELVPEYDPLQETFKPHRTTIQRLCHYILLPRIDRKNTALFV